MESNVTMIKPEALLRFVVYTSPDRQHVLPLLGNSWVDRQMALGDHFAPGSKHRFTSYKGLNETNDYVVAMLPLIQHIPNPDDVNQQVLHVTVFLAKAEDWFQFVPVEDLTPGEIRRAMLLLPQN